MGVIDKFLDFMRLNEDDYEFDNDDYEFEEDDYQEEKSKKKPSRKETRKEEPKKTESFENYEKRQKPQQSKITPISKNRKQGQQGMEVCVIKPSTINDELEIAETLLNGRTVVINMEGLSVDLAQRIIDFTSGATYAMHGNLQKISSYIFLATPSGTDISGDIQNVLDSFDLPGFEM
ncbi:MAG: cell division protein SepF [Lachnospiraceae bacterium]|nr:cell division protein SepF [Lachnospiraceae bacterium]